MEAHMKQNQNEHLSQEAIRIHHLVKQLNQYRHEYYNMNAPSVSDAAMIVFSMN